MTTRWNSPESQPRDIPSQPDDVKEWWEFWEPRPVSLAVIAAAIDGHPAAADDNVILGEN